MANIFLEKNRVFFSFHFVPSNFLLATKPNIFHYDSNKLIFSSHTLLPVLGCRRRQKRKQRAIYTLYGQLQSARVVRCIPFLLPRFTSASTPTCLHHPSFRDAKGILNPVLQHWWIRFTRKLFPYVSPRASFFYSAKSTRAAIPSSSYERRLRASWINQIIHQKILRHLAPFHGDKIIFRPLNRSRSAFCGRNTSFRRNHCTDRWGWKTRIFRTMVASCMFQRCIQISKDSPKSYISRHMYVCAAAS